MFPQNIVLIGFMGTGKSSIGKRAARILGFRFVDTDHLITERAGMEILRSLHLHGEAHFRDLETETLRALENTSHQVVATGGGIVLREENRRQLRSLGFTVALTAREDVLFERVSRNTKRPLLQTADPQGTIHKMVQERAALYAETAQFLVDTSDLGQQALAELIAHEALSRFPSITST